MAHSLLPPARTRGRGALRATNGAGSTIRTPALRQWETAPKRVPFRRVLRYYFAAVPYGLAYHGSVWWINPRGSLLRAPGPNDASLGRNAKSREIFLGPKPRKNLYMVANPSAPGRPGARALRRGGENSRYLRPAAGRGTSRRISALRPATTRPLESRSKPGFPASWGALRDRRAAVLAAWPWSGRGMGSGLGAWGQTGALSLG
jgi:hypothetical protein